MITDSPVLTVTGVRIKTLPVQPVPPLPVVPLKTEDNPHPDNLRGIASDCELLLAVETELILEEFQQFQA